jgi:molybdopterin molybdotransferase
MNRPVQRTEVQGAASKPMTVSQARACMLAHMSPLPPETVLLRHALGRVLAEHVIAQRDHPPYAASAMDGYAVRAQDTPGPLQVIGETAAGRPFVGVNAPGAAVRISTGAALPDGADTVVVQEDVSREGDCVTVPQAVIGRHIRDRGLDFMAGAQLLRPRRRLDGVAIALAAASGAAALSVARRPRIAILCGGDELAEPGIQAGPFQIYDSASHGVAALIESWGGVAHRLALEQDDAAALARAARVGLEESDLLVVIGGASVGDHDHARTALGSLGLQLYCAKVAVRPGKPTWFGETPFGNVLGLPGNPASALVCAYLFLRPILEALAGRPPETCTRLQKAVAADALPENCNREHYLRAFLTVDEKGALNARAHENQDSSLLSVFAATNGLIRRLPSAAPVEKGELLDVLITGTI